MTVLTNPEHQNKAEGLRRQVRSLAAQNDIDVLARLPRDQLEVRRARQWNGSIPGRTALWTRTEISATASTR
jgi:hypothetical protein